MTQNPLIELKNVQKKYEMGQHTIYALKALSLKLYSGEKIAIEGASGSGKSTLMNIIGLLDSPDSGEVLVKGQEISTLSEDKKAVFRNRTLGFVFQQFHLLPRLNAIYNVMLPMLYRTPQPKDLEKKALLLLKQLGMSRFAHHKPAELSGGQQQRIAIARALITNPDIILADEPTGALDSQTGQEIMSLFNALHQAGKTLIMVTHDPKIAAHCQRRIRLKDGVLIEEQTLCPH